MVGSGLVIGRRLALEMKRDEAQDKVKGIGRDAELTELMN